MCQPPNITWQHATVSRARREKLNSHKSVLLWFTGLSGTGKSTLAHAVEEQLHQMGHHTFVLDGDNVRHGLCSDLGFSKHDRTENVRRVSEMAKLFVESGVITMTALISPFRADRERARLTFPKEDFLEIYYRCPLQVCENRDVKGLYQKVRTGEIKNFTGISSPYEEPIAPDLVVDTSQLGLEESVEAVLTLLRARGIV